MAFLSETLGRTITDIDGRYIGKLEDPIARELADAVHPIVDAVVVKDRNKTTIIHYILVMALFAPSIPLKCRADEVTPSSHDLMGRFVNSSFQKNFTPISSIVMAVASLFTIFAAIFWS